MDFAHNPLRLRVPSPVFSVLIDGAIPETTCRIKELMLEIRSLSKSFQEADHPVRVLDSLDLKLGAGETAALLGESGSGKTTLLNLISGLDRPNAGEILIDSESTQDFNDVRWNEMRRKKLGLVFQQYHLVPTLSVSDNLKLQARLTGRLNLELFDFLESKLGLTGLLKRLPHQLSGGQQQRVAIGRALMHQPKLVLADEPTANLDSKTGKEIIDLMLSLNETTQHTFVVSSHDPKVIQRAKRVLNMEDGRICSEQP